MKIDWQQRYYCKNPECKRKETYININDLLPGRVYGYDNDQFLSFFVKCPNCGNVNVFPQISIPIDVAKELMTNYAGGKCEVMLNIWKLEYEKKQLEEKIKTEKEKYNNISSKITEKDKKYLFPDWKSTDEILENEKSFFQKTKKKTSN